MFYDKVQLPDNTSFDLDAICYQILQLHRVITSNKLHHSSTTFQIQPLNRLKANALYGNIIVPVYKFFYYFSHLYEITKPTAFVNTQDEQVSPDICKCVCSAYMTDKREKAMSTFAFDPFSICNVFHGSRLLVLLNHTIIS